MTAPLTLAATGTATYSTTTVEFGSASMQGNGSWGGTANDTISLGPSLMTMEAWIWFSSNPSGSAADIVAIRDTTNSRNWFIQVTTGGAALGVFWSGGVQQNITSAATIVNSTWHHVALVINATTGVLYVDGSGTTVTATPDSATGSVVAVGITPLANGFFLSSGGFIDEAAFFNYNKYTANFTPPTSPYTGVETGLLHVYHLDSSLADGYAQELKFGQNRWGFTDCPYNAQSSSAFRLADPTTQWPSNINLYPGGSTQMPCRVVS